MSKRLGQPSGAIVLIALHHQRVGQVDSVAGRGFGRSGISDRQSEMLDRLIEPTGLFEQDPEVSVRLIGVGLEFHRPLIVGNGLALFARPGGRSDPALYWIRESSG